MRSIIHAFSLPMIIIIGFSGYCLIKYANGTDNLSKANSLCSMNYTVGNWMDKELFAKFDPRLGDWTNTAWQYIGQGCFYTVSHINGVFDSNTKWSQTQLFNTSQYPSQRANQQQPIPLPQPTATQSNEHVYQGNPDNTQIRGINEDE